MAVIAHRPKATELALLQAGYSLADIRGERETHTVVEQPQGALAAIGRVTPRSARLGIATLVVTGLFAAFETGHLSAIAVSLIAAYGLHALGQCDPDATEVTHEIDRPGMSHHEVQQRMIQWDEWQRMKEEKQKEATQQAQKNQPSATRRGR